MRLVEAEFPEAFCERVNKYVELASPIHWRVSDADSEGRCVLRAVFETGGAQEFVDALQGLFEKSEGWRIIVLPVEATAPQPEEDADKVQETKRQRKRVLREEIYDNVAERAALSSDFFVLTFASTIVAALGLNADNIAAVIGAMVIAPLLGPILAISFGVALGDFKLLTRSVRNAVVGLALGVATAVSMGLWLDVNLDSNELMSRTTAGLDSVVLALAAGVAAALSVVTGISAALVGVMVAVALLPPTAAAGLFLGAGEFDYFGQSMLLLMINIVCIMLAAQGVYLYKGIRPRTWLEKKQAGRASIVNLVILVAMLLGLVAVILLSPAGTLPEIRNGGSMRP